MQVINTFYIKTCYNRAPLSLDFIINLFKQKVFSDPGSSSLKEQDTYFFSVHF